VRFKYARLTIEQISTDPEADSITANIAFDWRAFESDYKGERDVQVRSWTFPANTLQTIFEKLGKKPANLVAIGAQIWRLFPPKIQEQLLQFDVFAQQINERSTSVLPLMIHTDYLSVPWELCITRRDKRKDRVPWYKRFLVATQVYGLSRVDETPSRKEERKKVAVVLTPFNLPTEEEELSNEYDSFLKLIQHLRVDYGIDISLYERPKKDDDLYNIESVLRKGTQDLLIYIGGHSTDKDRLPIYNPLTEKPEYFEIRNINADSPEKRAVFLDACSTAIRKRENDFVCEEPERFLTRSTAYIGTIGDIPATTGIAFARALLRSLFTKGASLAEAFYEARNETFMYLGERYPHDEGYKTYCPMFALYGRNDDILLNSFRFPRESVDFLYPQMIEPFISRFRGPIYPSSLPVLRLRKKETLEEVVDSIEHADGRFIADLSITHATQLIALCRGNPEKELLIIGGIFRLLPTPSDSTLYIFGDLAEYSFFYSPDSLATVSIMAISYFLEQGSVGEKFISEGGHRKMKYREIYDNACNAVRIGTRLEPFILIGSYRQRFEEILKEHDYGDKLKKIPLYSKFLSVLQSEYPEFAFSHNLPAEVLVTRRKDVEQDDMMYREIFTKWIHWAKRDKEVILPTQEVFIALTEEDKKSLLKFSGFVSKVLRDKLRVNYALTADDFHIVRAWEDRVIEKTNCGINKDLETFLKKSRQKIEKLGRTFSKYDNPEGRPVDAEAVKKWLCQFGTVERAHGALVLIENIDFIDRDRMREMFVHYFKKVLPEADRERIMVTHLGSPYDSSSLISYFLGDSWMADLAIPAAELRSILDNQSSEERIILFVDDIIGSGKQARNIFTALLGIEDKELREEHETRLSDEQIAKLRKFEVRLLTLIGFEEGKKNLLEEMQRLGLKMREVYSFRKLEEGVGCFHPATKLFDSTEDRENAEGMCREIGYELFSDKGSWDVQKRKERSLGYGNSQKLIVFFYNVPTCTLPILWKKGTYGGRKWEPLFPRREKRGI